MSFFTKKIFSSMTEKDDVGIPKKAATKSGLANHLHPMKLAAFFVGVALVEYADSLFQTVDKKGQEQERGIYFEVAVVLCAVLYMVSDWRHSRASQKPSKEGSQTQRATPKQPRNTSPKKDDDSPSIFAYSQAIHAHAKAGDVDAAEKAFAKLEQDGIEPNVVTYCNVLHACAKVGDIDRAAGWLANMKQRGVEPNDQCYNCVIDACAKAGNIEAAQQWVAKMHAAGCKANEWSYNGVISACAKCGNVALAEQTLQKMKSLNLEANQVTYTHVIHACGKGSDVDRAEFWLSKMQEENLQASAASVNGVIEACAMVGNLDRAEEWMHKMKEMGIAANSKSFGILVDAFDRNQDTHRAAHWFNVCLQAIGLTSGEKVLEKMIENCPNGNSGSIYSMVKALAQAGHIQRCEYWLKQMMERKCQADLSCLAYSSVIQANAKAGDLDRAEWWLNRMEKFGLHPDALSYTAVIIASSNQDDLHRAEKWLQLMVADKSNGVVASTACYSAIVKTCAKVGKAQRANKWVAQMTSAGIPLDFHTYNHMINAHAKSGEPIIAAQWMDALKKELDLKPDVVSYATLIHAFAKQGDVKSAKKFFAEMKEFGVEPNTICFNSVIDACARIGAVEEAEKYLLEMEKAGCELSICSYNTIINAYAKVGDVDSAERWLKTIVDNGMEADVRSYTTVIEACAKGNLVSKAEEVYARMLKNDVKPTIVTVTSLAKLHARRGDWHRIESIMSEFPSHGLQVNEFFLSNLLSAYAYAKPHPQSDRAVEQLRAAVYMGVKLDRYCFVTFSRAVGAKRAHAVLQELGVHAPPDVFAPVPRRTDV